MLISLDYIKLEGIKKKNVPMGKFQFLSECLLCSAEWNKQLVATNLLMYHFFKFIANSDHKFLLS